MLRRSREEKAARAAEAKAAELRVQAAELGAQARALSKEAGAGLAAGVAELAEKAAEVAERVSSSDAADRARERSAELASAARARSAEAGAAARKRWQESELDERAAELADALGSIDSVARARDRGKAAKAAALTGLGGWLASNDIGEQMGVGPRRSRWSKWIFALIGVGAGYALGVLTAPKRGDDLRDDWASASSATVDQASKAASRAGQDTQDVSAPPAQKPLADKVRTRLGEDPRTRELPKLNVNVVEGTVFVRGAVAEGVDDDVVRSVIASVEGVQDVDLQLTRT